MDLVKENWNEIKLKLKEEFNISSISYSTWIEPLEYYKTTDDTVLIIINQDKTFSLDYIKSKYTDYFRVIISETIGKDVNVSFILKNDIEETVEAEPAAKKSHSQYENDTLNPKYKFETFVVGKSNDFAHSASLAVAESPGEVYNPLYIYGGPGLGKTHLMHSIGHFILEQNPNKKVIYVTSEQFTNDVIESIRSGNAASMSKLRDKYRSVDVLMVDDVQFIIGKESTQEEFFNTFNALHEANKQIVLSSDKPPKDIHTLEERFRTRFSWGLTVDIQAPDYETRMAILRKAMENIDININDEIINYIATNITTSIRELEGALNKIVAYSKLHRNNNPTIENAQESLKDMISTNNNNILVPDTIVSVVAESFDVKKDDITSQKRNAEFVLPRQVVMYLCHDLLDMPYLSIAKLLGKKDHTTIIHGVNKIKNDISTNKEFARKIDIIKSKLA